MTAALALFHETLYVCQPFLSDASVAGYIELAEQAIKYRVARQVMRACLLAARAAGDADARRRRLALLT